MGNNLVIVAIPAQDEPVWKLSSEKVPHLTLLFLGDSESNPNTQAIVEFVDHAVTVCEHGPFMMEVDYRDVLGPDQADVLFFQKRNGGTKWIENFRNQLLQNNDIRAAYESVEQYEEWTPHLTMGYPTAPAKPSEDNHGLHWIDFDRIAVWTGDYEGPEFRLQWPDRVENDIFYSDVDEQEVAKVVSHHGVKGMRWGQRNASTVVAKPKNYLTKKQTAAVLTVGPVALASRGVRENLKKNQAENDAFQKDKKWEKDFKKAKGFGYDDQKFTKEYNAKWEHHDFSKENWDHPSPTYQKYMDGYFKEMATDYAKQFADHYGESPSGKYEAHHVPGTDMVKLRKKDTVQHADLVLVAFRIIRDDNGLITGLEKVEDSMAQAAELGIEFLNHHGVKGMRWGVRKSKDTPLAVDIGNKVTFGPGVVAERVKSGAKKIGRGLAKVGAFLADSHWQHSTYNDLKHEAVHNHVAKELDNHIERLQRSPKYRGKNLKADSDLRKTYYQDVAKVSDSAYRKAVKEVYGENYTGTKHARFVNDVRGPRIEVRDKKTGEVDSESPLTSMRDIQKRRADATAAVTHADVADAPDLVLELTIDDNGQITGVGFVQPSSEADSMAQIADIGLEFLEHHGIKGMRWGQRKEQMAQKMHDNRVNSEAVRRAQRPAQNVKVYDTIGPSKHSPAKIATKGGEDHPPTKDAIKVAEARQKLKKSGHAALTNQELQDVANRLQLEQRVTQLEKSSNTKSAGRKFIEGVLGDPKQQQTIADVSRFAVSAFKKRAA